jgi:two-component system, OmpR family, phosphate regulon sensor histidine kinase PhoR
MTSLVTPEISLYELAASSEQTPFVLQTSPVTFKSLVSSLIDLLVEQQISASIWAKMPRGEAWQAEIDRYGESPTPPGVVYLFRNQKEDSSEKIADSQMAEDAGDAAHEHPLVSLRSLSESQLKRDYFLLVWSKRFCALLVAYRSKPQAVLIGGADAGLFDSVQEEPTEKKQSLSVLLSMEPQTICHFLDRLKQFVSTSDATAWETLLAQSQPSALNPGLVGQLFTKQIQRQEDLWQRATTHRKQAEMAHLLQLQNEELLNAIRLKDEFLNNVGQELRTPLTNMKTALTLLNSPSLKPPQKQRYMDLLVKECDRQSSLITSLLDLVSLDQMAEQTTIQALRLSDVVPGVVSTYQPLAEEKGVRLAYTIPEELPSVSCLNTWLKQIVINLLHNGIKFTPRGGQVWVRAKQQGDYVQLEFRDTGIGIAPSEIPKIFDRFYRVRQAVEEDSGGAGLGLTIVQQLLLHCGGSISVKSRLSEGSTFNVLLPIFRQQTEIEEF